MGFVTQAQGREAEIGRFSGLMSSGRDLASKIKLESSRGRSSMSTFGLLMHTHGAALPHTPIYHTHRK